MSFTHFSLFSLINPQVKKQQQKASELALKFTRVGYL